MKKRQGDKLRNQDTPEHDEMVIYLLKIKNIAHLLGVVETTIGRVESEVPIKTSSRRGSRHIVGYWDLVVKDENHHPVYFIEIKPTITSFGATLRQIKRYQDTHGIAIGSTYLITKDDRFKEAFEDQGIKVILYPISHAPAPSVPPSPPRKAKP